MGLHKFSSEKKINCQDEAHSFNPNTCKAEAGRFLLVWGQSGLNSRFQANQAAKQDPVLRVKETEGDTSCKCPI